MSDLFHPGVPDEYVRRVYRAMFDTPRHRYQVLTMSDLNAWRGWPASKCDPPYLDHGIRRCEAAYLARRLGGVPALGAERESPGWWPCRRLSASLAASRSWGRSI